MMADYDRGILKDVMRSIMENKLAVFCTVILAVILLLAIFAPLSPYDPDEQDLLNKLAAPSIKHLFGTDDLGRDYFYQSFIRWKNFAGGRFFVYDSVNSDRYCDWYS